MQADTVLALTARLPNDALYNALMDRQEDWAKTGVKSVSQIGDCVAPSIIAAAVHSGTMWARSFDRDEVDIPSYLPMPLASQN